MHEEKLSFVVTLSGTFWDKRPQFSDWLDQKQIVSSEIADESQQEVRFEQEVNEGPHTLIIRLENKTSDQTVLTDSGVMKDMLLNIDDITIDDLSLGNLLWSAEYKLDERQMYNGKEIDHMDGCVNLGWNGAYTLKFTSPFYIWLLEKL